MLWVLRMVPLRPTKPNPRECSIWISYFPVYLADDVFPHVRSENFGDNNGAVGLLVVF